MARPRLVSNPGVAHLAWYRTRATLKRRWPGYVGVVVLIGLLGGLAMGSVAAARRTDSSFTIYWKSTDPSDLVGFDGVQNAQQGLTGYDPTVVAKIRSLPHVKNLESYSGLNILPLDRSGAPKQNVPEFSPGPGNGYASDDGLYFEQDRVTAVAGRVANPNDPDEFMLTPAQAAAMGLRVGDVVRFGIYTNAQINLSTFGTAKVKPYRVVDERLVGLASFNFALIVDQAQEGGDPDNLFTPALARPLLKCCVNYSESGVQVTEPEYVATVEAEINRALPTGAAGFFGMAASEVFPKAQGTLKPESLALGVFGGIVGFACLLVVAQVIGNQMRIAAEDRAALRSLGASVGQVWADGLLGTLAAVLLGGALAIGIALAMSPLAPLGPVRAVYPDRGVSADWAVLGLGSLALVVLLAATAVWMSYRLLPHEGVDRASRLERPSHLINTAAAAGLPASVLAGLRFALLPGSGRRAVPVRSAMVGAVIAVTAMVATVTFGSSLSTLVSHPALYGWNWTYVLVSGGDLPGPQATRLLNDDRYVASWSGVYTPPQGALQLDGQNVPTISESPNAAVAPPLLSGHGIEGADEVVLGASTLAALHKHLGGTVTLTTGGQTPPKRLRIVGTATIPALGNGLEMGVGALVPTSLVPSFDRNQFQDGIPGPNSAFLRVKPGADLAAAYRSLQAIAVKTTNPDNFGVSVANVQRPAEILDYRSLGATPAYLGAGLAVGAVAALGLILVALVRRRRRDLAMLKTLGFTQRQLAATVAWHATASAFVGVIAGVPIGIALGRWLWDLFVHQIDAVPAPTVPVTTVVLIALGAIVVANLVAAVPGRLAARTSTAVVLRSE